MEVSSSRYVTTRGDLDGSDLGTGSSSSISSSQTLPSISDSAVTAPDDLDARGSLLAVLANGRPASSSMGYEGYGQSSIPPAPPFATSGASGHSSAQHSQQPVVPDHDQYHPYGYFGPGPSDLVNMVNIKERSIQPLNQKLSKSTSRAKAPERRVRFNLEPVEEDVVSKAKRDDPLDAPIPCDPINCPEARLALENARLPHSLTFETSSSTKHAQSAAPYYRYHTAPSSSSDTSLYHEGFYHSDLYSGLGHTQNPTKASLISSSASRRSSGAPCSSGYPNGIRRGLIGTPSPAYGLPRPAAHISEVEGDNQFPIDSGAGHLVRSINDLEILIAPSAPPNCQDPPSRGRVGNDSEWLGHDRHQRNLGETVLDVDLSPDSTSAKKPKEIFRKLLGNRTPRYSETGVSPFIPKLECNQHMQYSNLEARKEWAFVAVSPDSKTIVGICDRECFMTYSMDLLGDSPGTRMVVCGEFEGEPLAIAVSNTHLAILTLTMLQVFDHHNGRKIYEWTSDKSVAAENFTSLVFANSGLELCVGLTNGTIQFHYVPAEDQQDYDPDDIGFRRGDPRMDIALSSGDYAFTMSFSGDDMRFACGTQKRMLVVYGFQMATGWELRNKFKFSDWVCARHAI
ncbi:hypothetical protein DRE_03477 [Drechslerella stenobrocha 248]|uniref:Uncharacterized protein n=1 Tax=Drechslerella stenobrocha 248 TaxID=1043628 RepID=W7I4M5_9PEZI|nr:hypothetical protein DRE_03477 [Drechslerella stenobrocha 248]